MFKERLPLKKAPYWYNTPFDQLDFEWTVEEELMIERLCEKIHKNIEEEGGMTPYERFEALMFGKDKDRMFMGIPMVNVYPTKTLDSAAEAVKPIDVYQFPKLFIMAHLSSVARWGLDYPCTHNINYGEDLWGGQSLMIEYGNPILEGKAPIKSLEDLEGMPEPDPYKVGLYPGYMWAHKEMRRIFTKYKLPMPIMASICPGPPLMVMMGMMGWTEFSIGLRKNPELVRACTEIATKWLLKFGKAMIDECKPDIVHM